MRKISFAAIIMLLVVASCTKKSAPTSSKPATDGSPIFAQNCSRCHGATGVEGRAPNLAEITLSKSEIASTVSNGAGRMPSFTGRLSAQQIDAVAEFVSHLRK